MTTHPKGRALFAPASHAGETCETLGSGEPEREPMWAARFVKCESHAPTVETHMLRAMRFPLSRVPAHLVVLLTFSLAIEPATA